MAGRAGGLEEGTTTTTTETPGGTTTVPTTTLSGAPETTTTTATTTTEEPASPGTQDSDGDGFTDSEEINQLGTAPFDADDPGSGVIRQALTQTTPETTTNSSTWWQPLLAVVGAAAGLLLLAAARRRRCEHCGKPLTYQAGTLVDGDNNYECADNPDGNHHEKRQR